MSAPQTKLALAVYCFCILLYLVAAMIEPCDSGPCFNGGTCKDLGGGNHECTCATGWRGRLYCNQVDFCASNPCENGGTCYNSNNMANCKCASGWEGQNCTENIDDCLPHSCMNGGTCNDLVNEFNCTCAPGWEGQICDRTVTTTPTTPTGTQAAETTYTVTKASAAVQYVTSFINVCITFTAALGLGILM